MPLVQAYVQLYRARLFRDHETLAEARRLIETATATGSRNWRTPWRRRWIGRGDSTA